MGLVLIAMVLLRTWADKKFNEEGMKLFLWNEDTDENGNPDNLVVEATAHFNKKHKIWEGVFDWENIKHESGLIR